MEESPEPVVRPEDDLPEFDHIDPLKRDADEGETLPGPDPIVSPVPPE